MAREVTHARTPGRGNRQRALCGLAGRSLKFRTGSAVTCTLCQLVRSRGGDR